MKKIILLLLICLPYLLAAQRKQGQAYIDSLLTALPKLKEDTVKEKVLHALAYRYLQIDPGKSMEYGKAALALSENLNYKKGIASSDFIIADVYSIHGDFPEAMKNITAALKLFHEMGNKEGESSCYGTLGKMYIDQDNYPEALKNLFLAVKLKGSNGANEALAIDYVDIGNVYCFQKNNGEGLKYYTMALNIAKAKDMKGLEGNILLDIAVLYLDEGNNQEALNSALLAIKIAEKANDKSAVANGYNITGSIYDILKNYPEALKNYTAAIKMMQEMGAYTPLANTLGGIGTVFYNEKKYVQAKKYYEQQLALAQKIGALASIRDADEKLSRLYAATGDNKRSLETYKAFIVARDSMYNEENTKKIVRLQMQDNFDKKEDLARLQQEKKDALVKKQLQQKNVLIYSSISAFIVLLAGGTSLIRQNKLKANQQKIELEQKQMRAQMNPHFIFNCLNTIQHFVVANDVKNAGRYLSDFAILMRRTLENSKDGTITLRKELDYLKNYLSLELMRFEDKFSYEITCAADIDKDDVELPSMIIQPFIENAIRHGLCYLKEGKGKLLISFYLKDTHLFCTIDDNGIGREQSQKLKIASEPVYESHSMELTRQRLSLVSKSSGSDYKIEITDKKNAENEPAGTTVVIKFPRDI